MKASIVLLLLLFGTSAQVPVSQRPADLDIVSYALKVGDFEIAAGKATAILKVRNTGSKLIDSVSYDYVVVDRVRNNAVVDRLSFTTKAIKPGQTRELKNQFDFYITARSKDNYGGYPVITRVVYGDGSVWESPRKAEPTKVVHKGGL